MTNNLKISFLAVGVILLLFSCNLGKHKNDPVIAQVDEQLLRLSDIQKDLGDTPETQLKQDYIEMWVENKLWLKEAQRYIHKNDKIKELVKEYENSLLIKEYQKKYLLDKISITEGDVREYYKNNESQFKAYKEAAYIQLYTLTDKENAVDLLENLKNSIQPNIPSEFKLCYKGEFIDEINDYIFSSKSKKYIGPIKHAGEYYVIVIIEKYSKDSALAMEHVRIDIIQRLRTQAYISAIDKKQNELKDQYNVKIIKNTDK